MSTVAQHVTNGNHLVIPGPLAARTTPEALCSVNIYFDVTGYGKAQATGRGATAKEAAANLLATMQETRAALEAKPVISDEARLGSLLTCGLKKAVTKGDFALVERLTKAAALVLAGAVSPGEREGMLAVQSLTTPAHWYEVDDTACTCPDYKHRHQDGEKTFFCKHGLAAMMYTRLQS